MTDVRISKRITAPAADIFRLLADPRRHLELDGSDMLRGAVTQEPVRAVGDVFVMRMFYVEHGDYQMNNHIVEFETDRRIGWEPEAGLGHPAHGAPDARWGHRWSYHLEPDGPDSTVVTQIYDCSRVPESDRLSMRDGRIWTDAMEQTLGRLAVAVTTTR